MKHAACAELAEHAGHEVELAHRYAAAQHEHVGAGEQLRELRAQRRRVVAKPRSRARAPASRERGSPRSPDRCSSESGIPRAARRRRRARRRSTRSRRAAARRPRPSRGPRSRAPRSRAVRYACRPRAVDSPARRSLPRGCTYCRDLTVARGSTVGRFRVAGQSVRPGSRCPRRRGSIAPVMTSTQRAGPPSASGGAPAACVPAISNARTPDSQSRPAIAIPSIVTRSNGGWSRSAATSSASTRSTQSASGSRLTPSIGKCSKIEPFGFGDFCHLWFHSRPR